MREMSIGSLYRGISQVRESPGGLIDNRFAPSERNESVVTPPPCRTLICHQGGSYVQGIARSRRTVGGGRCVGTDDHHFRSQRVDYLPAAVSRGRGVLRAERG